jgi:hypothetical protein
LLNPFIEGDHQKRVKVMKKRVVFILILLVPLLVQGISFPVRGATISKDLSLRLEQIDESDYQSCILIPVDQIDTDLAG